MRGGVLLTVDTELTWRHYAPGRCWRENLSRSFEPAGVGVPWQLERLAAHGLKACFFVDPMPALLYGIEPVARMVEPILAAGQEVQLHLHPFWAGLAAGEAPVYDLADLDRKAQQAMLATARELLIEAGAPAPIAFRAGSFAANSDTIAALAALGIRYDSSHNGGHHPRPSNLPLGPRRIAPARLGKVIEVPVGQVEEGLGRLRHLQICAISMAEMRAALRHAADNRHPLTTIVSHSFELATTDGLRPNRIVQSRFEGLCAFLDEEAERLPTLHFADLPNCDVPLDCEAAPLAVGRVRRARRVAEQVWSGARYERPAEAATVAYGSSLTGIELLLPLIVS